MLPALADFYPSLCDMQTRATGVDPYGVPNGAWANVTGLTGLACSVNRPPRATPQEVRTADDTVITTAHRIALAAYCPAATPALRAVVDGVAYNIESVNHDPQHASTTLLAELVTT